MKTKLIFSAIVVLLVPLFRISAQTLENIPGQTSVGSSDLIGYLNNLYNFGISITGILAIFMIALGSFAYIVTSAGNSSKMLNAKETIQNALIGLVIALAAYLFLFVINPDLVSGTLQAPTEMIDDITNPPVPTGGATPTPTPTPSLSEGDQCSVMTGGAGGTILYPSAPACSGCPCGYDPPTAICNSCAIPIAP